ncbi:MAG: hypothetical protein QOG18_976, partial [Microbacteriaceae bacterium]|nr:hypothetical protein [Microbacteriaceae bacterium]
MSQFNSAAVDGPKSPETPGNRAGIRWGR